MPRRGGRGTEVEHDRLSPEAAAAAAAPERPRRGGGGLASPRDLWRFFVCFIVAILYQKPVSYNAISYRVPMSIDYRVRCHQGISKYYTIPHRMSRSPRTIFVDPDLVVSTVIGPFCQISTCPSVSRMGQTKQYLGHSARAPLTTEKEGQGGGVLLSSLLLAVNLAKEVK